MDLATEERAAIMQYCGGYGRIEAERLAKERPWESDPHWGKRRAVQQDLIPVEYRQMLDEFYRK